MAKVLNNVLGTFSGSIGGMTFSSNQFGTHVYMKVPKVKKNGKQASVMMNLAKTTPIFWTDETDSEKSGWNAFAKTLFSNPRSKPYTHFTGPSVFKSCVLSLQALGNAYIPCHVLLNNLHDYPVVAIDSFPYPALPPSSMVKASLYSLNQIVVPLQLGSVHFSRNGNSFFNILYTRDALVPQVGPTFSDPNGNRMGIAVYANGGCKHGAASPTNYWKYLLFWTGFLSFPGTDLNTSSAMTINVNLSNYIIEHFVNRSYYSDYYLTVVVFSTKGCMARIGGIKTILDI
jgi:hypothetical protein